MSMPKTSMNKYSGANLCDDDIRFAWQVCHMVSTAIPLSTKHRSNDLFGGRVFAANSRHVEATLFNRMNINHARYSSRCRTAFVEHQHWRGWWLWQQSIEQRFFRCLS